jgi:hypothetical protein
MSTFEPIRQEAVASEGEVEVKGQEGQATDGSTLGVEQHPPGVAAPSSKEAYDARPSRFLPVPKRNHVKVGGKDVLVANANPKVPKSLLKTAGTNKEPHTSGGFVAERPHVLSEDASLEPPNEVMSWALQRIIRHKWSRASGAAYWLGETLANGLTGHESIPAVPRSEIQALIHRGEIRKGDVILCGNEELGHVMKIIDDRGTALHYMATEKEGLTFWEQRWHIAKYVVNKFLGREFSHVGATVESLPGFFDRFKRTSYVSLRLDHPEMTDSLHDEQIAIALRQAGYAEQNGKFIELERKKCNYIFNLADPNAGYCTLAEVRSLVELCKKRGLAVPHIGTLREDALGHEVNVTEPDNLAVSPHYRLKSGNAEGLKSYAKMLETIVLPA